MLTPEIFKTVVRYTPLIAIDLIIEDAKGRVLLGKRVNSPAKGYWFVPGGRIIKDESFEKAFVRISTAETSTEFSLSQASFIGIYQHIYPGENYLDDPAFGTHYITIAYLLKADPELLSLPDNQHSGYRWATVQEILESQEVHVNTKNYFNGFPAFSGY